MPAPSRCTLIIRGRQVDMRLPDGQAADIRWAVLLNVRGGAADAAGCTKKVVSPKGKRLTTFCASLVLLHPLLSLTHWIFGSLSLPYKSSSHSAKCVRCASLRPGGGYRGGRKIVFLKARGFRRMMAPFRAPFYNAAKRPPPPSEPFEPFLFLRYPFPQKDYVIRES